MVARLKKPGLYPDGGGLYLQVTRGVDGGARRSWVLRFRTIAGKPREMGLGSALDVALADARIDADAARKLVRKGLDPIEERKLARKKAIAEAVRAMSFKQCAEAYIAAHEASWKNPKHRQQWSRTLETYAYPVFGDLPVNSIDVALVTKVLDPIWQTKTETAARVRGRIESVLDWASVRGLRDGANPARWRGHLQRALPARSKVQRVRHHPALPYVELPAFVAQLRTMRSLSARALEFLILTATRTSETTAAEWREFDFKDGVWIIPPERMKAGREHRVPLSRRALALLRELKLLGDPRWVFPGNKGHSHLSNMAMLQLIRGIDRPALTVHGFRSTFRDWTAEQTNFPREVAEAALAHAIGDKVEAAYRRGDLFEKRRGLMKAWGDYCCGSVEQGISGTSKRAAGGTQGSA
ncbi:MAG: tyrosine-type recombinase/integrase [Hyphomonadaceae bacterium]